MSFELDCIKRITLGREGSLPSDEEFLRSQGYESAEEFFSRSKWHVPDPCYFIWAHSELAEHITGTKLKQSGELILMHVGIMQFHYCITETERRFIGGESGFFVIELSPVPYITFGE